MRRFNFFSEIKREAKLGDFVATSQFVVIDLTCAYFEGIVNILSISDKEIDLKTKHYNVRVSGSNLEVVQLSDKTTIVRGKIEGVNKI